MDWTKIRILLVHSDIQMRRWAHDVLHKQKVASVQSTRSPAVGLDLLKRFAADVALVQLHHSEMTAVDFVRRVRDARSANPHLPVVAIVDTPDDELQRQAEAAGIAITIPRKVSPEVFVERIAAAATASVRSTTPTPTPASRRPGVPMVVTPTTATPMVVTPVTATPMAIEPAAAMPAAGAAGIASKAGPQEIAVAAVAAEPRPSVPLVEPVSRPALNRAEDWAAAMAPGEPAAKGEPALDLAPVLNDHAAWLGSRGSTGKRAALDKADLHGRSLHKANLASAGLREVDLSDADLSYAVFTSADLRRADLSGADLTGANLSVSNLRGASLRLAKLSEASLRGADLAGACLTDAALAATDFAGANLLDADIRRSDLTWAVGLTQSQVNKARADSSTRMPLGIRPPEFDD